MRARINCSLPRDVDLLVGRQRRTRALFAVAKRRVEYDEMFLACTAEVADGASRGERTSAVDGT